MEQAGAQDRYKTSARLKAEAVKMQEICIYGGEIITGGVLPAAEEELEEGDDGWDEVIYLITLLV